jgi:hypothetical protein
MAQPRLAEETAAETVRRVNEALREGHKPQGMHGPGRSAIKIAAEQAVRDGFCGSVQAFESRLTAARVRYGLEPDDSIYRPRVYQHASPVQPIPPSQDHTAEPMPEGDPIHIAVIGDAHDSPHLPNKERFYWLGRYISERRIPWVVSIGDWLTLDSMSSHTDPGSFEGLAKPSFEQDIDSFHKSQRAFQDGLGDWRPKKDLIYGNHCLRAARWANQHRQVIGNIIDPAQKIEEAWMQWGWRTTPFGEFRFIGGVGFIHAPLVPGTAAKTYGGKTGGQRAANDAMFDIVRGDDHKFYVASAPKIGPVKSPRVFGCATAFPPGYIETYARKNPGDWESGICELTVWGGRVRSFKFEDMSLLQRAYGKPLAA